MKIGLPPPLARIMGVGRQQHRWTSFCPELSVGSDIGTLQSNENKDKMVSAVRVGVSEVFCHRD